MRFSRVSVSPSSSGEQCVEGEQSAEVNPRLTLDTAVTSCSTEPPCFVEGDDEGAVRGIRDGVRGEVDDGVDV